jgi:hypothetical protein
MIEIFSPEFQKSIKEKVSSGYLELIEDIRAEVREGFSSTYLSNTFLDTFRVIIFNEKLSTYSPLKFYWTHLLNDMIFLIELHEEAEESQLVEEEIFTFWENGDFADAFFTMLDEGRSITEVSTQFIALLENQILAFFYLHMEESTSVPLLYTIFPEIGDFKSRVYLTDSHKFCIPPGVPDSFPSFPLSEITPEKITFNLNEETIKEIVQTGDFKIAENLNLLPNDTKGIQNFDQFKDDIIRALDIIKEYSPNSYNTFKSFTHSLIPVDEPGIVSYSMQSLPGYSSINMFERDFVDLMDDLLHENGHHYLNTFLNFTDLIVEDDDKIYYSPWRKALRPIRGIYHATFTFFWALNLFGDLLNKDLPLSEDEKEKIKIRFIEEYYMLTYCYQDLEHAFANKKINQGGMDLINQIYTRVKTYDNIIEEVLNSLKDNSEVLSLKKDLGEKREKYNLN